MQKKAPIFAYIVPDRPIVCFLVISINNLKQDIVLGILLLFSVIKHMFYDNITYLEEKIDVLLRRDTTNKMLQIKNCVFLQPFKLSSYFFFFFVRNVL